MSSTNEKFRYGHLQLIDYLKSGDPAVAAAISSYSNYTDVARQARHWARVLIWMENIFFGLGRHYIDDILVSRLSRNSDTGELSRIRENARRIPRPTNDLLGRYIETNIALLTENRPRPRVTAKSDKKSDQDAATLSELTIDFLWEALKMPEKHRELARLLLYCGTAWLEVCFDPLKPKIIAPPQPDAAGQLAIPGPGGETILVPVDRQVDPNVIKRQQRPDVEFGDIDARVISPFEMHLPAIHDWFGDDLQWTMRESYTPIDSIKMKYGDSRLRGIVNKTNGYFLDNIERIEATNAENLPLWWWERLTDVVEGPGPSLYVGTPETWADYTTVRILDRKPSDKWPKGRTIIVAGGQVIYDSPKDVGARAYDPRWPNRWHPYIRYRWEPIPGSIYARSLVAKLLPKLKRVDAIDTTLIMWRRTVPIASWIMPKGCLTPRIHCVFSDGTVKAIEEISANSAMQSLGSVQKVKARVQYQNDETVIELKATGLIPIQATAGHHIPIISAERVKQLRSGHVLKTYNELSKLVSESDFVDTHLANIKKGDWILTSFTRERSGSNEIASADHVFNPTIDRALKPIHLFYTVDTNFLRLLGLYLAEGCVKGNHKQQEYVIQFTVGVHERHTLVSEIVDLLKKVFNLDAKIIHDTYGNGERLQIQAYSTPIAQLFKSLCGKGSANKRIHPDIFTYPGSLLSLVGGWIDGDGCSHKPQVSKDGRNRTWRMSSARTVSANLAYQMRGILLDEKIISNLTVDNKRKTPIYTLTWDTTSRRELATYVNKFKVDTSQKTSRQGFWVGNCYASKVKSLKIIPYTGPVYDLEIADKHYYQANGVIVHNTSVIEDLHSGRPASYIEYDPRRTNNAEPKPVFPPAYPASAIEERTTQISEMEAIAGTEEILRGERPAGVTSAAMLDALRKQALASRSATLQEWDESLQEVGTSMLQETVKHIRNDPRYAERIRVLAREKLSRIAVDKFSGTDLSDNVVVRVDTASLALLSREAKQQRALEFLQYAPSFMQLPLVLREKLLDWLNFDADLKPQGPDINRCKSMIQWIKDSRFELAVPFPEDDPYVFHELMVAEMKSEEYLDWNLQSQQTLIQLMQYYQSQILIIERQKLAMQQEMGTQDAIVEGVSKEPPADT